MLRYSVKMTCSGLLLILGLVVFTFFLIRLSPGSPGAAAFDPNRAPDLMEQAERSWGLDQPVWRQFLNWIVDLIRGDLGRSYASGRPVTAVIGEALPNTLILTLPALLIQVMLGLLLGVLAARRPGSFLDRGISGLTLLLYAMPTFWLALLLLWLFSFHFGLLPSSHMASVGAETLPLLQRWADRAVHLLLPLLSMSLVALAVTTRYVRGSMIDELEADHVTAARARGLPERRILFRHALRNALVPVVTNTGHHFPALIGSSIVVEIIFSWPGMGRLIVLSCFARDYPVIIAITFIMALFVVVGNLLADLLSAFFDPRIRLDS